MRTLTRALALAVALGSTSCKQTSDKPSDSWREAPPKPSAALVVEVEKASLDDLLRAYRKATGADLGVAESTRKETACLHFDLSLSAETEEELSEKLEAALEAHGLKLSQSRAKVIRDRGGDPPCPELTPVPRPKPIRPPRALVTASGSSSATPASSPDDLESAPIECVDELHCKVERSAFDAYLTHSDFPLRMRIVPSANNAGLKLLGLRANSAPARLHLKNGDTVTAVNGHPTRSLDDLMELQGLLSGANEVQISFVRRGEARTLIVTVVPDGTLSKPSAGPSPSASAHP
ncbi:MAG: S1C family serine protease [Polyangiaceae bacterium]